MAYIAAADFRELGQEVWTANLLLTEGDGTDAYIDACIALATSRVQEDLNDDFEPPSPDNDITIDVDGWGGSTLYVPRRIRSITSLSTRDSTGTLTLESATTYRVISSLNAGGTGLMGGFDQIEALTGLTSVGWPWGIQTVRLVGKFGWSAVPEDVKRLVAIYTYELVKSRVDPTFTITQRTTVDGVLTFGESLEVAAIVGRYRKEEVRVA
jgi:hypothetical protein